MYETLLNNLDKTHVIGNYTIELCDDGFSAYINNLNESVLKDVYGVRTRTEEQALKLCDYLHKAGKTWCDGEFYKDVTYFNDYKDKTIYLINRGKYTSSDRESKYVEFNDLKSLLFTYKYTQNNSTHIDTDEIYDMYGNLVFISTKSQTHRYENPYVEKMIEIKDIIVAELKKEYNALLPKIESGEIYDASLFEDMNILIKNEI